MTNYIMTNKTSITIKKPSGQEVSLPLDIIAESITKFNSIISNFKEFEVDVFALLGMRNLSAFLGEVFASVLSKASNGLLLKNPHQDGYPDLLLLDNEGNRIIETLKTRMKEKEPFSGFINGGIEIKATCGSVPTPAVLSKRGLQKPEIGDTRINLLTGYDWKAHHRETNNLLGLLWDFKDGVPFIAAIFYSSSLEEEDWGKIVKPKEDGGRTTSVSIMTREGIRKMHEGCICCIDDCRYMEFLGKYNSSKLLYTYTKRSSF
ncbi:MAG: hypothetical protein BWX72_01183 [Firmicutes bacterium ADurb.Bin080]|jgi:hypothetical protein|nr:MAG: hypothetical protein BWX72_01183 [Firmicutes bacterium ADurb.Bin080]